jgi:hypothetical protein
VDTTRVPQPHPGDHDDQDSEASPHACNSGWITIGQIVVDETGEETEEFALYLCRRCAGYNAWHRLTRREEVSSEQEHDYNGDGCRVGSRAGLCATTVALRPQVGLGAYGLRPL